MKNYFFFLLLLPLCLYGAPQRPKPKPIIPQEQPKPVSQPEVKPESVPVQAPTTVVEPLQAQVATSAEIPATETNPQKPWFGQTFRRRTWLATKSLAKLAIAAGLVWQCAENIVYDKYFIRSHEVASSELAGTGALFIRFIGNFRAERIRPLGQQPIPIQIDGEYDQTRLILFSGASFAAALWLVQSACRDVYRELNKNSQSVEPA